MANQQLGKGPIRIEFKEKVQKLFFRDWDRIVERYKIGAEYNEIKREYRPEYFFEQLTKIAERESEVIYIWEQARDYSKKMTESEDNRWAVGQYVVLFDDETNEVSKLTFG